MHKKNREDIWNSLPNSIRAYTQSNTKPAVDLKLNSWNFTLKKHKYPALGMVLSVHITYRSTWEQIQATRISKTIYRTLVAFARW